MRHINASDKAEKARLQSEIESSGTAIMDLLNTYEKAMFTPRDRVLFEAITLARTGETGLCSGSPLRHWDFTRGGGRSMFC